MELLNFKEMYKVVRWVNIYSKYDIKNFPFYTKFHMKMKFWIKVGVHLKLEPLKLCLDLPLRKVLSSQNISVDAC